MVLISRIDRFVELLVEAKCIRETAAAAAGDANPQQCARFELLVADDPLNFVGRFFRQNNRHDLVSPQYLDASMGHWQQRRPTRSIFGSLLIIARPIIRMPW